MGHTKIDHYLTKEQLEYFRGRLINWKSELLKSRGINGEKIGAETSEADTIEQANKITEQHIDLRTKERAQKLIKKIDKAIQRIDDGTYGYCEETGEPIGLKRLEARPIATLCIEAQERHEKMEKEYKENAQ